ncbi:cupin domain-containing protein [Nonomuraea pusilla]|uniref:cupin domain-containing protein n=1 Tax=Nonomuraea pusilla TaxID=46177 RepID=UPI003328F256
MSGFPGAVGVSQLCVYAGGGSPHLHTASTEGYVVLRGSGTLSTLGGDGPGEHPLEPGAVLWFTPGTVHRLVNPGDDLEILVVMQNSGLPEAGDAVLTFPADVLADPEAYARAAAAPRTEEEAARRRDLAVEGFEALRERVRREGPSAMKDLYETAARLVAPRVEGWRGIWEERVLAQARRTAAHLDALAAGDSSHLAESSVTRAAPPERRFGMCGRLRAWDWTS